jgi:hypothetical protein
MSAELELALLVLHRSAATLTPAETFNLDSLATDDLLARMSATSPDLALGLAAGAVDSPLAIDRFAAAQAFVLGVLVERREDVLSGLTEIADAQVAPFEPVDLAAASRHLIHAVRVLTQQSINERVPPEALHSFSLAFGSALQITGDTASAQVAFSGPAARPARMLIDLARTWRVCTAEAVTSKADGGKGKVTRVEIDICTNLSFERCQRGVDPMHWPECNPYFKKVTRLGNPSLSPDGWAGQIREVVGPSLNKGRSYTTDLLVRVLRQSGLAVVAFDLVPSFRGPVSVDRGFVSVTEEGLHRRVRVFKIYRIDDLKPPLSWVCPLWVWQVALAGWWCG